MNMKKLIILIILICLLGILTIPFSAFAFDNVRKDIKSWCQDKWQTNGYLNKDQCVIKQHKAAVLTLHMKNIPTGQSWLVFVCLQKKKKMLIKESIGRVFLSVLKMDLN